MKPHLILKLHNPVQNQIPYWEDILNSKTKVPQQFNNELDQIFLDKYKRPFWLTQNFKPSIQGWSQTERASGLHKIYRVIFKSDSFTPDGLIQELNDHPYVSKVSQGNIGKVDLPNQEISQTKSLSAKYRNDSTYLQDAHFFSKGLPEIKIAVLDTGFDLDHKEIVHAFLPGKDFVNIIDGASKFIGDFLGYDDEPEDEVGHGTHVTGIIAAKGISMAIGVVPNCKIIPVKVLGALKRGNSVVGAGLIDNINNGIKWAVDQGADIINMSLGIKHIGGGIPHEEVIEYARRKGVTIVAASGNDGQKDKYYPGALPGVIAVGAADGRGSVAPFSTYGGHVSILGPGVDIFSSFLNNSYAISSGTSQASPFVSGGIALLKSYALKKGRNLKDQQVKYLLKHTADKVNHQFKDNKAGYGNINLLDALKLLNYKFKIQ